MKKALNNLYYFLPVQLLLLHFRRNQLLLSFWLIIVLTITGHFAAHFGASALLLAPEYLGRINFTAMFLFGSALAVFFMTWHITTFIIHTKRLPYMGATRHAFSVYCLNNSLVPLVFLIFYSVASIRFQIVNEHNTVLWILKLQMGFYLGITFVISVSFLYFFRVSRDFFKSTLTMIARPYVWRRFIPRDNLDYEPDVLPVRSFVSSNLKIEKCEDYAPYHPRVMNTIMSRHHRNVIFAAFFSYVGLFVIGQFMDYPFFRIPAGAGFVLLFSIFMGFVGAFKYFMKSWEALGWLSFAILLSLAVSYKILDLRSVAYGIDYKNKNSYRPYDYDTLRALFTPEKYYADKAIAEARLDAWEAGLPSGDTAPLVVVSTSGGGLRSTYWTFNVLQYLDSLSGGALYKHTVLMTGASGGMIGSTYWRALHEAANKGLVNNVYERKYSDNAGKDLLNAVIFSLATVDLISPINKISFEGNTYHRDRGYAFEHELVTNTEGLLSKTIGYYTEAESKGKTPQLIISPTIINDGRRLIISTQPVTFLTQPEYSLKSEHPPIDAVDFQAFLQGRHPEELKLTSALRMNATFPFVLPEVKLPAKPFINVMDAGLRDNFGMELANRYLFAMRDWVARHQRKIIVIEIRDSREFDVILPAPESGLGNMLVDPLFVIQNDWEAIQSYKHSFMKEYSPYFLQHKVDYVTISYVPKETTKFAALNFHLTTNEKQDIYQSLFNRENQAQFNHLQSKLK